MSPGTLYWSLLGLRWGASALALWLLGASAGLCWRAFSVVPELPALQAPAAPVEPENGAAEPYGPIVARDLFRAAARSAPPVPEPAAPSQSGLLLLGTVFSQPADGSLAIVRDPAEPRPRLVAVGASMRGAEVVEIERGALLLSRSGRIERLVLHTPLLRAVPARDDSDAREPQAPQPGGSGIRARPLPGRPRAQRAADALTSRRALRAQPRPTPVAPPRPPPQRAQPPAARSR